jgi:hypothetical protein
MFKDLNWHGSPVNDGLLPRAYDERRPLDATYPSLVPSQAELVPESQVERSEARRVGEGRNGGKSYAPDDDDIELKFAPPGSVFLPSLLRGRTD